MRGIQRIRNERCLEEFHASFNSCFWWSNIWIFFSFCITLYFATKDLVRPFLKPWEIQGSRCKIFQVLENAKAEQSLEKLFFQKLLEGSSGYISFPNHGKTAYFHLGLAHHMEVAPVSQACMCFSYYSTFKGVLCKTLVQKPPVTPFRVAHQCACSTSLLSRGMPFVSMC